MAALFAAEVEAVAQHFINDVLVTYSRWHYSPTRLYNRCFQAGVAHDGGDQRLFRQGLLFKHLKPGDRHDIIAIYQLPCFIAEQNPVGVAVMRDPEVSPMFPHFLAHELGMHRTAIFVDVFAIGLIAVDDHFRAQFAQNTGGGFVARAMRAIHNDAHAFERHSAWEGSFSMFDVPAKRILNTNGFANFVGCGPDILDLAAKHEV